MSPTQKAAAIRTPRLTLRRPERADAGRVTTLAGDFEVARMTRRLPHPYGPADAEAFLETMQEGDEEIAFVVDLPGHGLVGMIGLSGGGDLGPELGYWIGRPYWGRGLASEATRAVMGWAGTVGRRRVACAGHFRDNPASARVLDKAGFLYTGVVRRQPCLARGGAVESRMMVWLA